MSEIDSTDVKLLTALQANAKCKLANLAKMVQLSIPAVRERLEKLLKRGIIKGHHTVLDHKQLDLDVTAFVRVGVRGSQNYSKLISMAESMVEIQELHSITGDGSHLLKLRAENTGALERILSRLQTCPGLEFTSTHIVLTTLKESSSIPLSHLSKKI